MHHVEHFIVPCIRLTTVQVLLQNDDIMNSSMILALQLDSSADSFVSKCALCIVSLDGFVSLAPEHEPVFIFVAR